MLKNGVISAILTTLLCSCANPQVVTQTVKQYPPTSLLNRYPVAEYQGQTNLELVRYILQLQTDLRSCDADMAALTEWAR